MVAISDITPQARLAITREAIIRHMNRGHGVNSNNRHTVGLSKVNHSHYGIFDTWNAVKHAFFTWWHRHPASTVVELSKPIMSNYASSHSIKLLGISAAFGAVVILAKPWRIMSAGNWLVATIKLSGLRSTVVSLLMQSRKRFKAKNLFS